MVKVIAHRGASSEAPENTISSILRAVEIGVDYIEVDVHLSADGTPVVIHDPTLCRTTDAEKGRHVMYVSDRELKNYDAGAWFHGEESEDTIPTLEEVFELKLGPLMVEIKDDPEHALSKAVMKLLEKYESQHALLGSFSVATLAHLKTHYPHQPLIGIAEDFSTIEEFRILEIDHLAIDHHLLSEEEMRKLKQHASAIWAFTVDDSVSIKRLLGLGIQGIITNDPRSIKTHLNR